MHDATDSPVSPKECEKPTLCVSLLLFPPMQRVYLGFVKRWMAKPLPFPPLTVQGTVALEEDTQGRPFFPRARARDGGVRWRDWFERRPE